MGEGKLLYISGKFFTNFSNVKHFIVNGKYFQIWLYFTYKQTLNNGKTFFEKYFTSKKKWNLSFRNLNPTQNKNLLLKFQDVYICTNGFSVESLLYPMFFFYCFFSSCNSCICICIGRIYMLYRFIGIDKFIWFSLSLEQFFP